MRQWWTYGTRRPATAFGDLQSRGSGDHDQLCGKLLGGLRIGWIRASPRTIASLVQTWDSLDLGSPLLEQLACCWLLENDRCCRPGVEHVGNRQAICCMRLG